MEEESPYIFEIHTDKPQSIRCLLEALKDLLDECNIHLDKEGLFIKAIEGSRVALVHVRLGQENFDKYYIYRETEIGINIGGLHKLLKNVDSNDILKLFVRKDNQDVLGVTIENAEKNSVITFEYNLLDIPDDPIDIPHVEFDSIITMPSSDLHNYFRLMQNIGTEVDIKSAGDELHFQCKGNLMKMNARLGSNGTDVDVNSAESENEVFQGRYMLKFLLLFTKAYNLSNTVEMLLMNDYPMILKYEVAGLGEIKYGLAPINSDE